MRLSSFLELRNEMMPNLLFKAVVAIFFFLIGIEFLSFYFDNKNRNVQLRKKPNILTSINQKKKDFQNSTARLKSRSILEVILWTVSGILICL